MTLRAARPTRPAGAIAAALALAAGPLAGGPGGGEAPLRVAVAANFRATFDAVAEAYHEPLAATFGASGLLYAQIVQGRPFDLFLSADAARPRALIDAGRARAPTTYAIGRIALLVREGAPNPDWLTAEKRVAIANPNTAPYGRAAAQALAAWSAAPQRITASNVAQAFHFAASAAVDGAFVALAQVKAQEVPKERYWLVPERLHEPIEQVAVAIRGGDEARAEAFLAFLAAEPTQARIRAAGYR